MANISLKPLGNRVLVETIEQEAKTPSGIIIPDSAKEKPLQAKVIAVGGDVEGINEGNTVLYGKFAGTEINFENKDYLILEKSDILAII
jgi:chaperonin GroES